MVDLRTDEDKAVEAKYDDLRALVAKIGSGETSLRSVRPELMVMPTGTEEAPEVTASLIVVTATGATTLEALTQLESHLRISAFGVQDAAAEDETRVDVVVVPEAPETPTLAEIAAEGYADTNDTDGQVH